jgi:hypothetical protein
MRTLRDGLRLVREVARHKTSRRLSRSRVRGIDHLRVVDASVMPGTLSCNIHAAVLAIAQRASDLIRGIQIVAVPKQSDTCSPFAA